MSAELTIGLRDSADDLATGDFIDLRATVTCRGFAGQTQFSLARRDLDAFIADLSALREARSDAALLLGGWEAEARLRLRIAPAGLSGRFQTNVRIANTGPREDQWHRVESEFVCPPDAVSAFLTDLQQLAGRTAPSAATLAGDSESVV